MTSIRIVFALVAAAVMVGALAAFMRSAVFRGPARRATSHARSVPPALARLEGLVARSRARGGFDRLLVGEIVRPIALRMLGGGLRLADEDAARARRFLGAELYELICARRDRRAPATLSRAQLERVISRLEEL